MDSIEESKARYLKACHAMQTGVSFSMQMRPAETTPKTMRVGINCAMVEHAALVSILREKQILTDEEYFAALADGMEKEAERYRAFLEKEYGIRINLA